MNETFKQVHVKRLLAFALIIILVGMGSYQVGKSTVGPGQQSEQWYTPEQEATYIIGPFNSTFFFAKNHTGYGLSAYEGYELIETNDDDLIQYCINLTTTNGGLVYVKEGTYSAAVTLKNNVRLVLANGAATISVSINAGASAILEDHNVARIRYWKSGSLNWDENLDSASLTASNGIFGSWMNSTSLSGTNFYLGNSQLGFVQPYSFIINATGSTYNAWYGANSTLFTSSTNASQVINNAIGNMTNGENKIVLKGQITLTHPIQTQVEGTIFQGSSCNISLASNADCEIFKVAHDNITIYDLNLDGNVNSQNNGYAGIKLSGSIKNLSVRNVVFSRMYQAGIKGVGTATTLIVDGLSVSDCQGYDFDNGTDHSGGIVYIDRGTNINVRGITGKNLGSAKPWYCDGINILNSTDVVIDDVNLKEVKSHGVFVGYGCQNVVINNVIFHCVTTVGLESVCVEYARDGSLSGTYRNKNIAISNVQHVMENGGNNGIYLASIEDLSIVNCAVEIKNVALLGNTFSFDYCYRVSGLGLHATGFIGEDKCAYYIYRSHHVCLDGFTVYNSTTYAWTYAPRAGAWVGTSDYIDLLHGSFNLLTQNAISADVVNVLNVEGCSATQCGVTAAGYFFLSGGSITNSTFRLNRVWQGTIGTTRGIYIDGTGNDGITIENNMLNIDNVAVGLRIGWTNLPTNFVVKNNVGYPTESGTSFPTIIVDGQPFYRSDLDILYYYNSTDWVEIGTGTGATGPAGTVYGLPYSYIVFTNSTATYLVNCTTSSVDFSSSSASLVFNAAFGNITDGGVVFACAGTYSITTSISMGGFDCLDGEAHGTMFEVDANVDCFVSTGGARLNIKNIAIDGNSRNVNLIDWEGVTSSKIEYCYFYDCAGDWIYIHNDATSYDNYVCFNYFLMQNGVVSTSATNAVIFVNKDCIVTHNMIDAAGTGNYSRGIYANGGSVLIAENHIIFALHEAIFTGGNDAIIQGNYIDNPRAEGIRVASCWGAMIQNNYFLQASYNSSSYSYLMIDYSGGGNHTITGNEFEGSAMTGGNAPYCINIWSVTVGCMIKDNHFLNYGTAGFNEYIQSSTTVLDGNTGYNPKGVLANPVRAAYTTMVDNGDSAILNNTLYTCWQSPKNIYVSGGTVSSVAIEGTTVFAATGCMVHVEPGDTFKIVWSSSPTIVVIAE